MIHIYEGPLSTKLARWRHYTVVNDVYPVGHEKRLGVCLGVPWTMRGTAEQLGATFHPEGAFVLSSDVMLQTPLPLPCLGVTTPQGVADVPLSDSLMP